MTVRTHIRLGEILVKEGLLTDPQLRDAVNFQKTSGKRMGEALVTLRMVTEEQLAEVLGRQLGIPFLRHSRGELQPTAGADLGKLFTGQFVREQLAGLRFPNDAVGTTRSISGTITFDGEGRLGPGSKVTLDLRTLRSDEAKRDNYLRANTLTTASFPYTELVPREVRGLPFPLPASGRASVQILGNLTVRGVTRPTTWDGTAEFQGRAVRLQARTAFKFGDFELTQPRIFRVLSIEDLIRLEVDLTLRQAS